MAFVLVSSAFPLPALAASSSSSGPLFTMTLIAPTSNPTRRQWASIITNSLDSLNIGANLVFVSFDVLLNDFFGCPSGCPPPTYANGGWDAGFVGFGGGTPLPDFGTQNVIVYRDIGAADVPPLGSNYYFFNNATFNNLSNQYDQTFTAAGRWPIAQQMLAIVMQQRPTMVLFYPYSVYVWSNNLQSWGGTGISSATANTDYSHWVDTKGGTTLNVAETGDITAISYTQNSAQNSYYMGYLGFPVQACGECLDPRTITYFDGTVSSVTSSANHLSWSVVEKAHTFSDGVSVSANDYIYNIMTGLINAVGEVGEGTIQSDFGLNTQFTFSNGTTDYVMNGTYAHGTAPSGFTADSTFTAYNNMTWKFTMPAPYIFTDPLLTGVGAVPMHLYETVPFAQWSTSWPAALTSSSGGLSTSPISVSYSMTEGCGGPCTGGTGSAQVYGPMGDGAYIYHGYDPVALVGTDVANPTFYNATGLHAIGYDKIQTVHVYYINDKNAAEAALANGQVNFLDSNYNPNSQDVASLQGQGFTVVKVNDPSNGWQEMGLNLNNPVFGTGTATPLGQSNPSQAAFAARMVREAISYAIPRSYIVSQLLGGLGQVGITQVAPSFTLAYPSGAAPDPFDLTAAKGFLAAAGYKTGVQIVQCPTCNSINSATVGGVTVPGFLLGNSFTQQGQFQVNPVTGAQAGGFAVTLQQSTDGGKTWSSVALSSTNAGGYFSFNYQPTVTGSVTYRVFLTGLPETIVNQDALGSAASVEALVPPLATQRPLNTTDVQYGPSVTYNIGSLADVITALTHNINAGFANETSSINTALSGMNTQLGTVNTNVNGLSGQISTLNSNLSTTTDIAYVAIAVAIILGIAAIALSRRKPA